MSDAILREWVRCRPWLLPSLDGDDEDEVLAEIFSNRAQLWGGESSAMVTQLYTGPDPFILVWKGGGDLRGILELGYGVEAWARGHGARRACIRGRRGWARPLRRRGFVEQDGELWKVL